MVGNLIRVHKRSKAHYWENTKTFVIKIAYNKLRGQDLVSKFGRHVKIELGDVGRD